MIVKKGSTRPQDEEVLGKVTRGSFRRSGLESKKIEAGEKREIQKVLKGADRFLAVCQKL